jgi:hypothetical protein
MLDRRSFLGSAVASVLAARRGNADATPSARRGGWPPEVLQDDEQWLDNRGVLQEGGDGL